MWDKLRQVSFFPAPQPRARCDLMLTYNTRGALKGHGHLIPSISGFEQFSEKLCIPLGQELSLFFFLKKNKKTKKHVYFSRNLIPGAPSPSHLHQLKWYFCRDMWSCRSLQGLCSAWHPSHFLTWKQNKTKEEVTFHFQNDLDKVFPSSWPGWNCLSQMLLQHCPIALRDGSSCQAQTMPLSSSCWAPWESCLERGWVFAWESDKFFLWRNPRIYLPIPCSPTSSNSLLSSHLSNSLLYYLPIPCFPMSFVDEENDTQREEMPFYNHTIMSRDSHCLKT